MRKIQNIIGKRFGKLTVVEYKGKNFKQRNVWNCKCDCGKEKLIYDIYNTKSCGCGRGNRLDLINKRFGKLTVLSFDHINKNNKNKTSYWNCKCDCGKKCIKRGASLIYGHTNSCGCNQKRFNKNNSCFRGYEEISGTFWAKLISGSNRGNRKIDFNITINDAWDLFIKQNRKCAITGVEIHFPKNSYDKTGTASLDRIDSNKGYTVDNIQWVMKEINMMKNVHSQKHFIELCKLVSKHNA
jgi:hypothetical protein